MPSSCSGGLTGCLSTRTLPLCAQIRPFLLNWTILELALGLEKKSIEEYTRLKGASTDAADLQLLDFLIEQEEQHYSLFEQLVTLLRRPVDWVEDAEFGKRDEY